MSALPAPTLYFGLRVGIAERPGSSASEGRGFVLTLENPGTTAWGGRIPVVWVQAGVSWTELFEVDLAPQERRTLGLATRWVSGAPALECRLPIERSPQELRKLPRGATESWAMTSNYVPIGTIAVDAPVSTPSPEEDRRDRLRQSVWLVVAGAIAVLAAILLVIYATSVL